MSRFDGIKSVKSRLRKIADSLSAEHGSYTSDDVFKQFEKEIRDLSEAEIKALIGVGSRVLTGRLAISRNEINWTSPFISGLGLHKEIRLRLQDTPGKYRTKSYAVQNITPKMIKEHEEGLKNKSKSKADSKEQIKILSKLAEKMLSEGYASDAPIFEYRG